MIVHAQDGKVYQVSQTDEGEEEVWDADGKKRLARGDLVEVRDGVLYCKRAAEIVSIIGDKAGE